MATEPATQVLIKKASGGTVSILSILGIILVTLKACGATELSWWQVTLPFWIVPAVLTTIFLILVVIACVMELITRGRK